MQLSGQKAFVVTAIGFFLVGLLIGWLVVGWWLWPVQYYDADPVDLREQHRTAYLTMVADSYSVTGDLDTARKRLEGWPKDELAASLSDLTTEYMQQGRGNEAQRLAALANGLRLQVTVSPAAEAQPRRTPRSGAPS